MKGQLRISESVITIFIVSILIVLGFVFYVKWSSASLERAKFEHERERFELLVGKIPNMAEFKCSSYGQDIECIDTSKLIAFQSLSEDYFSVFGYKNITIFEVYPQERGLSCTRANHLDCGVYEVYYKKKPGMKSKLVTSSPVSLYYPDLDEFRVGKLVVEWYS